MANWPQISIDAYEDITMCFGCGRNNPIGLKLNFTWDGKTARTEFTPNKLYQGWSGIVHGGIIECLLDEAMSYASYFEGIHTLTAKMQVRMRQPALIDQPLIITSSITKKTRKLVETKGDVSLTDGTPVAESTATMFIFNPKQSNATEEKPKRNVQKEG